MVTIYEARKAQELRKKRILVESAAFLEGRTEENLEVTISIQKRILVESGAEFQSKSEL